MERLRQFARSLLQSRQESTCFNRDGSASNHKPCGDSGFCCHEGDICLSNGLCQAQSNHGNGLLTAPAEDSTDAASNSTELYKLGTCQDKSWNSCLDKCFERKWTCLQFSRANES